MGQTPFSLIFGGEALIPVELDVYSPRVENASTFDPPALLDWQKQNESARRFKLDLLEEDRELAAFRQTEHKRRIEKYYNKHVHRRPFQQGDLVLKLKKQRWPRHDIRKTQLQLGRPFRHLQGTRPQHLQTIKA
ncbi:hypothetical protein AXF42_Ash021592 [Apostasia shenzhenica]|uniref:Uncharacterized protein n=1 Tax=Apostasia shenzhenica TaxID=1088818 RepID=A0A2H9ZTN8_9ASPA|nr:hypothetical protein AXF42_Ash021592 [Apostasia shenzhenica]